MTTEHKSEINQLKEDKRKLEFELTEYKAIVSELRIYEKCWATFKRFDESSKDYQDLQKDNTELKAENDVLIAKVEKVEKESHEYETRLKQLAWETVHCVSDKSTTSLELSKVILKLSETIKDLKEDTQKWYMAFNRAQGMCLDFVTQNRALREQLHGEGKVTAV